MKNLLIILVLTFCFSCNETQSANKTKQKTDTIRQIKIVYIHTIISDKGIKTYRHYINDSGMVVIEPYTMQMSPEIDSLLFHD